MVRKPKYTGILAEPMSPEDGAEAYWARVIALAEHYGIDLAEEGERGGFRLALALAKEHVEGFKVQEPRAAQPTKAARDALLFIEMVKRIPPNGTHTVRRAAQLVVQKHGEWLGLNADSARVKFEEMRNFDSQRAESARKNMFELLASLMDR